MSRRSALALVVLLSTVSSVLLVMLAVADAIPVGVGVAGGCYLVAASALQVAGVLRDE